MITFPPALFCSDYYTNYKLSAIGFQPYTVCRMLLRQLTVSTNCRMLLRQLTTRTNCRYGVKCQVFSYLFDTVFYLCFVPRAAASAYHRACSPARLLFLA